MKHTFTNKFVVGQTVYLNDKSSLAHSRRGIVTEINTGKHGYPYRVRFENSAHAYYPEEELSAEPIFQPRPTSQQSNTAPSQINTDDTADIESGLGIGGAGSDDFNIYTEGDPDPDGSGYDRNAHRPGQSVCPSGTTMGIRGDNDDVCIYCGKPGDWNSGAGRVLCDRHWDEY